jgi:hypothetical protein
MSAKTHGWMAELRAALGRGAADGVLSFGPPRRREQVLRAAEGLSKCGEWDCDLTWLRYLRRRRLGRRARKRTSGSAEVFEHPQSGG